MGPSVTTYVNIVEFVLMFRNGFIAFLVFVVVLGDAASVADSGRHVLSLVPYG